MGDSNSLVRASLQGAGISSAAAESNFWAETIGPGPALADAYAAYSGAVPLSPQVIFYETMSGARVNDNPFAIFEHIRSSPERGRFLHVWSLNAQTEAPAQFLDADDVVFVRRNTRSYAYFLAHAGRIIGNANLPRFFTRRPGQLYLNTWHGVPYKALGMSMPGVQFDIADGISSFIKATHVVSQCSFLTEALMSAYAMKGTSTALIAETGYPRIDNTVSPDPIQTEKVRYLLGDLGRGATKGRPVVLYAPTWRDERGKNVVDGDQLLADVKALASADVLLVYRGHHRMDQLVRDRMVAEQVGNVVIAPPDITTNALLGVVDILVTDYSSTFFDFLPTGRPIVHYLYDLDEYRRARGLNLEVDELPGAVAMTRDELVGAVREATVALAGTPMGTNVAAYPVQGERYQRAQKRFCPREDGSSTQRAVDFFLDGEVDGCPVVSPRDDRPAVLFWAGALADPRTSEDFFRQVFDAVASASVQATVAVAEGADGEWARRWGPGVSAVPYPAEPVALLADERHAYDAFVGGPSLTHSEVATVLADDETLRRVFAREYRNRLGGVRFDRVVLAEGLSNHEIAVACFADKVDVEETPISTAIAPRSTVDTGLLRQALAAAELRPGSTSDFWAAKVGPGERLVQEYIAYSAHVPVDRRVVFYEVMSGAQVADSPLAICDHLRANPRLGKYLHVWSLGPSVEVPAKYADADDVVFVRRNTRAYACFLAAAGWVVGNANLPSFFTRRPEQRYLNTWQGVPYEALGRDASGAKFGPPASIGSFIKATHVVSQCRFMSEALLSAYSMVGTATALVAETGYPRVDLTVAPAPGRPAALRALLGIAAAAGRDTKPVVLYAPARRPDDGPGTATGDHLIHDLKALAALDIDLVYRGHHRIDQLAGDQVAAEELGHVIVPDRSINSNELLTVVDVLITDYSSIFFDFIPTGRPIIHYLYDLDDHRRTRGLTLDLGELPGDVARSTEDLVRVVESTARALRERGPDADLPTQPLQGERYRNAQARFCPWEDGGSTERAVEFFFCDVTSGVPTRAPRDGRPTVMYWAGTPENASQADAFLKRVITSGRSPEDQTTVVVNRFAKLGKSTLQSIRLLRQSIATISFTEAEPVLLPEERAAYDAFLARGRLTLKQARRLLRDDRVLRAIFLREYRNRLDDAQFDSVVVAPYLTSSEVALAVFADKDEPLSLDVPADGPRRISIPVSELLGGLLHQGHTCRVRVWRAFRRVTERLRRERTR